MRTTIAFALCTLLLVVCFTPATAADKKLSSGDIKKLVKEYVEAGSTQPRREEIAEELKQADPAQVGKVLSKYCKDDAERPKALQLAIALKAPGLFKKLEDSFDTLDQQAIIDWVVHGPRGMVWGAAVFAVLLAGYGLWRWWHSPERERTELYLPKEAVIGFVGALVIVGVIVALAVFV